MLSEAHHVALHGPDLGAIAKFVTGPLRAVEVDAPSGAASAAPRRTAAPRPADASFAMGTCLLEVSEPRDRMGWHADVIRRSGRPSAVSHLAWRVENIGDRCRDLAETGVRVLEKSPGSSPHGRYRVINVVPGEATRGIWFQLAEDIEAGSQAGPSVGVVTHLHHVVHHVWGLEYTMSLLRTVFGVRPSARHDLSERDGSRWAVYRFGRTKAYFVEPAVFGSETAALTSRTGTLGGLAGGAVSEVGWAVTGLDAWIGELADAGVRFVQPEPLTGPCGDHRFIDTDPSLAGGVSFRLCEDAA
jgi:hypothetical protein